MGTIITASTEKIIEEVDAALQNETSGVQLERKEKGLLSDLPTLLRVVGAVLLIVAALTFMAQRWGDLDHIQRYLSFLGFTGILAAAGFFCGVKIKEDKGARTFLAIAAAIIPVHFCQLGALIYSRVIEHLGLQVNYPPHLLWHAPTDLSAFATVALGLIVIVPITFISFSTLIRSHAKLVTGVYLATNAALLIPTRDVNIMAALIAVMLLVIARVDLRRLSGSSETRTFEGKLVRFTLTLPLLALSGRTLQLYFIDVSALFSSVLFGAFAYFMFEYAPKYVKYGAGRSTLQLFSVVPMCISWGCLLKEFFGHYGANPSIELVVSGIPMALLFLALSLRAEKGGSSALRWIGTSIAVVTAVTNLCVYGGMLSAFICVLVGTTLGAYGYGTKRQSLFVIGATLFISGLAYHLKLAVDLYSMSPWISLGVVGVAVVLLSSYIERNKDRLALRIKAAQLLFEGKLPHFMI